MAFDNSQLYPGESIIESGISPPEPLEAVGSDAGSGRIRRNWNRIPHGMLPGAAAFFGPLIDPAEWDERIEEMERKKNRLSDLRIRKNIESLNQEKTNYCWCNAVISAMLIVQAQQGGKLYRLSPASVAARVKNYQNEGGFNGEALKHIVDFGVCSQEFWPPNAINPKHDNPASRADRQKHKITDWLDIGNRRFDQLMTLLLRGIPVAIGLDWCQHEVCALDPVKIGPGQYGVRIWNSYGDGWGFKGMKVFSRAEATPDDAVAPGTA